MIARCLLSTVSGTIVDPVDFDFLPKTLFFCWTTLLSSSKGLTIETECGQLACWECRRVRSRLTFRISRVIIWAKAQGLSLFVFGSLVIFTLVLKIIIMLVFLTNIFWKIFPIFYRTVKEGLQRHLD